MVTVNEVSNPVSREFEALVSNIPDIGRQWHGDSLLDNARRNLPYCRQSLKDLPPLVGAKARSGIVISAGPSLHRTDALHKVKEAGYPGALVCVDGAYVKCLKAGLIPDYVVTLDPHPTRVVRWFGDPDFEENARHDDYFARQDLDVDFRANSIRHNNENIELIDRHAALSKLVICTSSSQSVAERVEQAGFDSYWWNPLVDDPRAPDSVTRQLRGLNGLPCMNTGGTVGTAAWVLADAILRIPQLAVIGMDLGYPGDTPLNMTQTYYELQAHAESPEELEKLFPRFTFPLNGDRYYTDPTYFWYRKNLLELLEQSSATTVNCSEGGTLFGPKIACIRLSEFLEQHAHG